MPLLGTLKQKRTISIKILKQKGSKWITLRKQDSDYPRGVKRKNIKSYELKKYISRARSKGYRFFPNTARIKRKRKTGDKITFWDRNSYKWS